MKSRTISALIFLVVMLMACATGPAMTAALQHEALRVSCEKSQTELVEKAEAECNDAACVATAKAALSASHIACEAGMATLQEEIDALAKQDGGTDG